MRKGQAVNYKQLDSAVRDVQGELEKVGLWYEGAPLTKTEVYWCRLPQLAAPNAHGFFIEEQGGVWGRVGKLLGYEAGHIYIPSWVLLQGFWQNRGSLRDVLRHEYAHALMYSQPKLGNSKAFKEAFGGRYDSDIRIDMPADCSVSDYARSSVAEDFAETFMVWLRNPTRKWNGPKQLREKFNFIRQICK